MNWLFGSSSKRKNSKEDFSEEEDEVEEEPVIEKKKYYSGDRIYFFNEYFSYKEGSAFKGSTHKQRFKLASNHWNRILSSGAKKYDFQFEEGIYITHDACDVTAICTLNFSLEHTLHPDQEVRYDVAISRKRNKDFFFSRPYHMSTCQGNKTPQTVQLTVRFDQLKAHDKLSLMFFVFDSELSQNQGENQETEDQQESETKETKSNSPLTGQTQKTQTQTGPKSPKEKRSSKKSKSKKQRNPFVLHEFGWSYIVLGEAR